MNIGARRYRPVVAGDDEVLYSAAGGIARITINRPERRNALTWTAVSALGARLAEAGADPAVRVVVLTGAGSTFCAGVDLAGMAAGSSYVALHEARGGIARLFGQLWSLGKPTIAAVAGFAVAGGFGLALACDLVVCAPDAVFAAPEVDVGLWPFMITVPLVRSMPPKKALELMLTGRRVGAAEAERIGFVTRVADDVDAAAADLAGVLAAKSPAAVKLGRDSFYAVWDLAAADALSVLHPLLTVVTGTDDAKEGMAAFREKRPPEWTGT
jgi:enoyl-CoA hydratase/carnithine racemase